jgi:hypothetical protein
MSRPTGDEDDLRGCVGSKGRGNARPDRVRIHVRESGPMTASDVIDWIASAMASMNPSKEQTNRSNRPNRPRKSKG